MFSMIIEDHRRENRVKFSNPQNHSGVCIKQRQKVEKSVFEPSTYEPPNFIHKENVDSENYSLFQRPVYY
jgi:hypothetical protein